MLTKIIKLYVLIFLYHCYIFSTGSMWAPAHEKRSCCGHENESEFDRHFF